MEYTFWPHRQRQHGGAIAHAVSQTTKAGILADHNPQRAQGLAEELGLPTAPTKWSPKTASTSFSS